MPNLKWAERGDQEPRGLGTRPRSGCSESCGQGPWRLKGFCIACFRPVHFLWSVVFAVQGESVWVFECCRLLFFKGLLALPWGYCSRNSYLCFSPAYRLLTGTKWKTPAHIVCCLSTCFTAHGLQLFVPQCSFPCFLYFLICSAFLGKPSGCNIVTFLIFLP